MKASLPSVLLIASSIVAFSSRAQLPPGQVVGWGANESGQATGHQIAGIYYATNLVSVGNMLLEDVVEISAGSAHCLAIRNDGTVVGWGWNAFGQATGIPTTNPDISNGRVIINGQALSNVSAIAVGRTHSLALRYDGTVVAWGTYDGGKKVTVPEGLSNVTAIAAGSDSNLALKRDGSVVAWGFRNAPAGLSNIIAIAANGGHPHSSSLALKANGDVILWQPGLDYENGITLASNAIAISAGGDQSLVLKRDGTVMGRGFNGAPPVALNRVASIAAGSGHSLVLKRDGTLFAWGEIGFQKATVPPGLSNVVAIAAGGNFCLAITTNLNPNVVKSWTAQNK